MTRDDAPELKRILAAVYELHRKPLSQMVLRLWYEALRGYDVSVVSAAIARHLVNPDNGQFLPVPADIVKLIAGGSDDAALLAWSKVDRAVRMIGTYTSVAFDDAVIHHAIANMGGWIALGTKTADEWPFVRNQFVTLYRGARLRTFEFPSHLVGIAESHNSMAQRAIAAPRMIGDADKALAVYRRGQTSTNNIEAQPLRALLPVAVEGRAA